MIDTGRKPIGGARELWICLLACAWLLTPRPSSADETGSTDVSAAKPGASRGVEEIVIRGEKMDRTLQRTLSSVEVTTAETIRENGDQILSDVLDRTPGAFVGSSGRAFALRGVPVGGVSDFTEGDVFSIYVDGAIQSNRNVVFNPFGLWDVEQVEVFRSAQSTVQGRNAQFGSIVINTRDPSYETTVNARVNYGTYNTRGISGTLGGTLIPEKVAWRFSLDEQRSDGFVRNDGRSEPGDRRRSNNMRGKLLFEPTEGMAAVLTLSHSETRQGTPNVEAVLRDPFRRKVNNNVESFNEAGQDAIVLDFDYDLAESWTLSSVSNYSRNRFQQRLDNDGFAGELPDILMQKRIEHTLSQELTLGYDRDTLRAQLSAYYFRLRGDRNQSAFFRVEDQFPAFAEDVLAAYPDGFLFNPVMIFDRDLDNRALFGEVDWEFAPRWELSFGLRYDVEINRNRPQTFRRSTELNGVDPFIDGLLDSILPLDEDRLTLSETYRAFLPKIGLSYQVSDNVRLGVLAQKGYRAGGSQLNIATGETVEFDPEFTESVELSLRSTWLDGQIDLNANAYYIDYDDQQVSILTDPTDLFSSQIENAGESELFGVELDSSVAVTPALRLSGTAAVSRSVYREFEFDGLDFGGLQFESAPKLKMSLGLRYEINDAWLANVSANYQSRSVGVYDFDFDTGDKTRQIDNDAAFTVNATLQYRFWDRATLLLSARNIFNRKFIEQNRFRDQDSSVLLGEPRTLGIAVQYEFGS